MKIFKCFLVVLIITIVLSSLTILYGKKFLKHINYDTIIDSYYFYYSSDSAKELYSALSKFIIDDEISNANDLVVNSDYILIIKNANKPTILGNSIINNVVIEKIIKGTGLKENQEIKIYDLTNAWRLSGTGYFGGSTPLSLNKEYVVFLKNAPNPTIPNSYVFCSMRFGHISMDNRKYQTNYVQYSEKIKDVSQYDYVLADSQDDIDKYKKIVDDVLKYINGVVHE